MLGPIGRNRRLPKPGACLFSTTATLWLCLFAMLGTTNCGKKPSAGNVPPQPVSPTEARKAVPTQERKTQSKPPFPTTTSEWVERYDPKKAWTGYLLVFYRRVTPILIDMNGTIVHSWPKVRGVGRMRLTKGGELLAICTESSVRSIDWDGKLLWEFHPPGDDFPHHDLIQLNNGHALIICADKKTGYDYLVEVNRQGKVASRWDSREFAGKRLELLREKPRAGDATHLNSVQEVPPNRWYDEGDERFRPGNLLVSARHLNTVFVLDRRTGQVTWSYGKGLDWQHEAVMIEKGQPEEGNILIYNNAATGRYGKKESEVLQVNPITKSVDWRYRQKYFFTATGGMQQPLPNGNLLISSGGRLLEVTREKEIVWQWIPPFKPMRPHRYPPTYCPQLAAMSVPSLKAVAARSDAPYVDRSMYQFAGEGGAFKREKIHGQYVDLLSKELLKASSGRICNKIVVPANAEMRLSYGLRAMPQKGTEPPAVPVRFKATLRLAGLAEGESETLLDDTVLAKETVIWRSKTVSLKQYSAKQVELCLVIETHGLPKGLGIEDLVLWGEPYIAPKRWISMERVDPLAGKTAKEKKELEKRLKTLGYVD